MHNKLQIIYKNNKPYGIRDETGFLFFFTQVTKYPNQEERYRKEVMEEFALADYLLSALQSRGLTKRASDGLESPAKKQSSTAEVKPPAKKRKVTSRA